VAGYLRQVERRPLSPGLRAGTLACEEIMTSIVFWPLIGVLGYGVLMTVAWCLLISQVGKRDDP
jgi:hypothetical protein